MRTPWLPVAAIALAACSLPPLRGKAQIGKDPYALFVADGPTGADLFAVLPTGGNAIQVTFSPIAERAPALAPDGGTVAFLREPVPAEPLGRGRTVWLQNLLTGRERQLRFPREMDPIPDRVGWSRDGRAIYVATARGLWRFAAPPADPAPAPVGAAERSAADSSLMTLVGDPPFARVTACDSARSALCLVDAAGRETLMQPDARDPARWGPDSVGFFQNDQFVIRPVGPGRARVLQWTLRLNRPRELTFFPGRAGAGS